MRHESTTPATRFHGKMELTGATHMNTCNETLVQSSNHLYIAGPTNVPRTAVSNSHRWQYAIPHAQKV
jgi:hypothetical protein